MVPGVGENWVAQPVARRERRIRVRVRLCWVRVQEVIPGLACSYRTRLEPGIAVRERDGPSRLLVLPIRMAIAGHQMVVHHPDRLHEGVHDGRPDKLEAAPGDRRS